MMLKMTDHARLDRFNRLAAILDRIDVGEIIVKVPDPYGRDATVNLTSTGLILVTGNKNNKIITGYLCDRKKLLAIMGAAYGKRVERAPQKLWDVVTYNEKHYKEFFLRN